MIVEIYTKISNIIDNIDKEIHFLKFKHFFENNLKSKELAINELILVKKQLLQIMKGDDKY